MGQYVRGTWNAATSTVAREAWIGEWKRAGPDRTVNLNVVGARGTSETQPELFVLPPWKHAGFAAAPDFQLSLCRDRHWCATVYLSRIQAGALIATAKPGEGEHWLDQLDFSFHPRSDPPTYARVDSLGRVELREMR